MSNGCFLSDGTYFPSSIQRIFISDTGLQYFHPSTFNVSNSDARILELAANNLQSIQGQSFERFTKLRKLRLKNNKISSIKNNVILNLFITKKESIVRKNHLTWSTSYYSKDGFPVLCAYFETSIWGVGFQVFQFKYSKNTIFLSIGLIWRDFQRKQPRIF